jgi:hypothetical protein
LQNDSEYVVSVLELFSGQLSLEEILNCDIAFLRELCIARSNLIEEQNKAKEEALAEATSESSKRK